MIKTITKARRVQARREELRSNMTRRVQREMPDGNVAWVEAPANVGEAKAVRRFRKRFNLSSLWGQGARVMAEREGT
jgi:hypothetical protein